MDHYIPVDLLNFPGKYPKHFNIDVSREQLLHAAITTGKGGDLLGIRLPFAVGELVWKLGVLDGCVNFSSDGALMIDRGVAHLDPSEKGALAYILSNAQTGVIANRVLGATHVLHLKAMDSTRYSKTAGGMTIPDFVAIDSRLRNTFVIETKGTVGRKVAAEAERKAVRQLQTRIALAGYQNTLRYAHYSEFAKIGWRARLEYESGRSSFVRTTSGRVFFAYYAPLVDLLRQLPEATKPSLDGRHSWAEIPGLRIALGIWKPIVEAIGIASSQLDTFSNNRKTSVDVYSKRAKTEELFEPLEQLGRESPSQGADAAQNRDSYSGADGIVVQNFS